MKSKGPPIELADKLVRSITASFANAGLLDLSLPPEKVLLHLNKLIDNLPDDFEVVIDHTPQLLNIARKYRAQEANGLAVMFYATWIEHLINRLLSHVSEVRGLDKKNVNSMLRDSSLRAKLSWISVLLGIKQLPSNTVNKIQRLTDCRNTFVHYKWGQLSKAAENEQKQVLQEAESVVKSLRSFDRRESKLLSGRSKSIMAVVRKMGPTSGSTRRPVKPAAR